MLGELGSYYERQRAFQRQLAYESHRALALAPPSDGFVAFFGGSNLFRSYSMDRQLQAILKRAGRREVVLNVGSFGFCDSGYVVATAGALTRVWRDRRPSLVIYEVNPNEMPAVARHAAPVVAAKRYRDEVVLSHRDGVELRSALSRSGQALGANLNRLRAVVGPDLPVIVLDFETNVRDWPPCLSTFSTPVDSDAAASFRRSLATAVDALGREDAATMREALAGCDAIDPDVAIVRFLRGRLCLLDGAPQAARAQLLAARAADPLRGTMTSSALAPGLAEHCARLGFAFVSVPRIVDRLGAEEGAGFDVFGDEIHYQPAVHRQIAVALAAQLARFGRLSLGGDPAQLASEPLDGELELPFDLVDRAIDLVRPPHSPYMAGRVARGRECIARARACGCPSHVADEVERSFEARVDATKRAPRRRPEPCAAREPLPDVDAVVRDALGRRGLWLRDDEHETDLRDLGLDSLALLELLAGVLDELGVDVRRAELTLGNLRSCAAIGRMARRAMQRPPASAYDRSLERAQLARSRASGSDGYAAPAASDDRVEVRASTLGEALERNIGERGDQTALTFLPAPGSAVVPLSWSALDDRSRSFAAGLRAMGVRADDVVLLLTGHALETVVAVVAALRMGAVPSVLHAPSSKLPHAVFMETFGEIAARSGATLVVASPPDAGFVAAAFAAVGAVARVCTPEAVLDAACTGAAMELPASRPVGDSIAVVQYSSGTTGARKGVDLSHSAVLGQLSAYAEAIDLRSSDRIVSWLPLYHDMGLVACLLLPLVTATPLRMLSAFDWIGCPELLLQAVTEERATLAWMPNFAFHLMAERVRLEPDRRVDLSSLRAVINCSEPIDGAAWRSFHERLAPCGLSPLAQATCYALAENVFAATQGGIDGPVPIDHVRADLLRAQGRAVELRDPDLAVVEIPSSGRAIRGTELSILDEDGRELGDRMVGEIRIRSPYQARRHRSNAAASAQRFTESGYLTGDLGYLADGWLYVLGRRDDVIVAAGQNLQPADIETAAGRVPGIRPGRVVAFGVRARTAGTERVVVLAERQDGAGVAAARTEELVRAIRRAILDAVDVVVADVQIVAPGTIRKSPAGKPSRGLMRDLYGLGIVAASTAGQGDVAGGRHRRELPRTR